MSWRDRCARRPFNIWLAPETIADGGFGSSRIRLAFLISDEYSIRAKCTNWRRVREAVLSDHVRNQALTVVPSTKPSVVETGGILFKYGRNGVSPGASLYRCSRLLTQRASENSCVRNEKVELEGAAQTLRGVSPPLA